MRYINSLQLDKLYFIFSGEAIFAEFAEDFAQRH